MVEKDGASCNLHFFKPLMPGFSKKLAIPNAFVKHIVKEKCSKTSATLVSPNGESWRVDVYMKSKQENMYFCGDGWLEFVHAHNLELGYFLVFGYRGHLVFNFKAYDLSTCEITLYASIDTHKEDAQKDEKSAKSARRKNKITEVKVEDEEEFDDKKDEKDESIEKKKKKTPEVKIKEEIDEFTPKKKMKISHDKITHKKSDKFIDKRLTKYSDYKRRTNPQYYDRIKRNHWSNKRRKSHFEVTICPCNLSLPYVNVPWEFCEANGLTEHGVLILMDSKDRSWRVRLKHRRVRFGRSINRSNMSTGWQQFAVANKLKQGDKCIFELASKENNGKVVMKVIILKKSV